MGSHLRRLSETFLNEITRAYQNEGVDFDASWFPVFYLLSEHDELSIKELSDEIEVSHPAASQLVTGLKNKGLVAIKISESDGRKQLVTAKGHELLGLVKPVWDAIMVSMEELVHSQKLGKHLLPVITLLETALGSSDLAQKITDNLAKTFKFCWIMNSIFQYGTGHLTIGICLDIASGKCKGVIGSEATERICSSRAAVEEIVHRQKPVYGINTGFGPLCDTHISEADTSQLQSNILKSHSVGVGKPIPTDIAKLMLITKVHALAQGYSGIRIEVLERIIWHIDNDVIPLVPEKGSVGASGDLAPLSHLFLSLIGLGMVDDGGKTISSKDALFAHELQPLSLGPKEGLALITERSLSWRLPLKV